MTRGRSATRFSASSRRRAAATVPGGQSQSRSPLVLTDVRGQLPLFGLFLGSLVARAMNASYGRWEAFWAPSSYSAVALVTKDDVIEKAAYTLANPIASRLRSSAPP
jgi:hypothetical protein